MTRRDVLSYTVVMALLAILGGVAWLTQHPQSGLLRWAADRPLIGPWAERFRRAYGQPPPPSEEEAPQVEFVFIPSRRQPRADSGGERNQGRIWISAGIAIHDRPDLTSPVVDRTAALADFPVVERRGAWIRIRGGGQRGGDTREGWVSLHVDRNDPRPPLGDEPAPPLPMTGRRADPERLARARSLFGGEEALGHLGPYELVTDTGDGELIRFLQRLVIQLENVYVARYGLRPIGTARESVVLFHREEDYRAYRAGWTAIRDLKSAGHAGYGLVALYRDALSRDLIAATLLHELLHLLNRRALGPALPPWLDEGLADDLSRSTIDAEGRLQPGTVALTIERTENRIVRHGAVADHAVVAAALGEARLTPLPSLLERSWAEFVAPGSIGLNYAQSALWVRYLLDGEEGRHADSFRAFLVAVARGSPATAAALRERLDRTWAELELGFRVWILSRQVELESLEQGSTGAGDG
jgi:hypothetical protein